MDSGHTKPGTLWLAIMQRTRTIMELTRVKRIKEFYSVLFSAQIELLHYCTKTSVSLTHTTRRSTSVDLVQAKPVKIVLSHTWMSNQYCSDNCKCVHGLIN